MQTQNPFLDEFSKLTTAAMGLAQAAGEEAKTAFRAQADKLVAELDLVRRDEFDAAQGATSRAAGRSGRPEGEEGAERETQDGASLARNKKPVETAAAKQIRL